MFFVVVSFCSYLAYYLGAFKGVEVKDEVRGPYTMIYKVHTGPYHKIVSAIGAVEDWAKTQSLDCKLSFGQYFDNPDTQEEARLKSHGGCIVPAAPASIPEEFKVEEIPARRYVTAVFEGSPGIGPMKVYPKANEYMEKHGLKMDGAVIEVYEIHDFAKKNAMTTTYLFPVK
ncbi:Bacterial transcription activator, effector binding domain [compost metagenome]